MKKRSLVTMAILSVVTLTIYQIFWTYFTKQELVSKGQKVPPFKLLFAPVLGLVLVAIGQLFVHIVLNAGAADSSSVTTVVNILGVVVGVLAVIAIFPVTLYWYYMYCKAAEVVTNKELGFGMSYVLFIVLNFFSVGFLWPFIVQYYFNKVADESTPAPAPAAG